MDLDLPEPARPARFEPDQAVAAIHGVVARRLDAPRDRRRAVAQEPREGRPPGRSVAEAAPARSARRRPPRPSRRAVRAGAEASPDAGPSGPSRTRPAASRSLAGRRARVRGQRPAARGGHARPRIDASAHDLAGRRRARRRRATTSPPIATSSAEPREARARTPRRRASIDGDDDGDLGSAFIAVVAPGRLEAVAARWGAVAERRSGQPVPVPLDAWFECGTNRRRTRRSGRRRRGSRPRSATPRPAPRA